MVQGRNFFGHLLEGLARNDVLRLFEGDYEAGFLLPSVNQDAVIGGQYMMIGKIILHSILLEGLPLPLFPLPLYHYLVDGSIESALPYLDVAYLPPRVRVIVDQVRKMY